MQKYILVLILMSACTFGSAQKARKLFFEGIEQSKAGNDKKAIELYTKSLKLEPRMALTRYNRAISYQNLKNYDEAIRDLDNAIAINPKHLKSYLLRASIKTLQKKFHDALTDMDLFLNISPEDGEGEYYKARVYEQMGNIDSACALYTQSARLEYSMAKVKLSACNDSSLVKKPTLQLNKTAIDRNYGFSSQNPVKVGGSPITQRAYLDLLLDAQGNHITYKRVGSCCGYKSTSSTAIFGMAMVDIYVITYRNEKNKEVSENVYISFLDLEGPLILFGFSADK